MKFFTADLCDAHANQIQVVQDKLKAYGGETHCCGPITTIKLDEEPNPVLVGSVEKFPICNLSFILKYFRVSLIIEFSIS